MGTADLTVLLAAVTIIAGLGWYFFGPRRARTAQLANGVQRVVVTVRGGYTPAVIQVRQHVPLELIFDRQESGDCTSRVVVPDFGVSAALPAYTRTTVRLHPTESGSFGFACGMNMIHGTLVVDPADQPENTHPTDTVVTAQALSPPGTAADADAAQAKEQRAEITDLTQRVLLGAVFTLPVLFAVMAHELFGASWCPPCSSTTGYSWR